jgi:nucleotidyltransferase/DNA polymerase involved in DNA repair
MSFWRRTCRGEGKGHTAAGKHEGVSRERMPFWAQEKGALVAHPRSMPILPLAGWGSRCLAIVTVAVLFEPFPLWLAVHEQPELREKPLAAVQDDHILHANPLARKAGIKGGMRAGTAILRVTELELIPAQAPLLQHQWDALLGELYGLTPWLEPIAVGRVLLRISPADAYLIAEAFSARIGVAAYREIALLAALATPEGKAREVPRGLEHRFLEALPVCFLKGVGLGEEGVRELAWLGIERCGRLARWKRAQLEAYLGKAAASIIPYLLGPWNEQVSLFKPEEVIRTEFAFDEPAREPAELLPVLEHLSLQASHCLEDRGVARRLTLTLVSGGLSFPAARVAKEDLKDQGSILRLALLALQDTGALGLDIEGVRLELAGLYRPSEQLSLWRRQARREEAIRAVNARYPGVLLRAEEVNPWSMALEERYHLVPLGRGEGVDDAATPARDPRGRKRQWLAQMPVAS